MLLTLLDAYRHDNYYMPIDGRGIVDNVLIAIEDLLTAKLITEINSHDITRAVLIKAGPRQAAPESVSVLIHENHPDTPEKWQHRPMSFRTPRVSKGTVGDTYSNTEQLRVSAGRHLVGGGSLYSRSFVLEIEIFGRFVQDVDIERENSRQIASIVESRTIQALRAAGPMIGTGSIVTDVFGESVIDGPYIGGTWAEQEEGESLIVRKMVSVWYKTSNEWNTSEW